MLNVEAWVSNLDWMRYSWPHKDFRITCKQYRDMARGGNGGIVTGCRDYSLFSDTPLGMKGDCNVPEGVTTTTRQYYYPPGTPDSFFRAVCDGMGWSY